MEEERLNGLTAPDIDFTANVQARELHFDEVPEIAVRFWGHPEYASVSDTERKNLPEEIRRGTPYRNFSIQLRIATELTETKPDLREEAK